MMGFRTKVQRIHQLTHRNSRAEAFFRSYEKWQAAKGYHLPVPPIIEQCYVDLWELLCCVVRMYNLKQKVCFAFAQSILSQLRRIFLECESRKAVQLVDGLGSLPSRITP